MAVAATPPAISGASRPECAAAPCPRPAEPIDTVVQRGAASGSHCEMVEIHGAKVASFRVRGRELVCLPQVFELFLKHLVGGLHTVYTRLKRLDICPVVCTIEQVRALRGLGAIQPGVNRCKLIAREDFEALYSDCASASSRPGRPPKRSVGATLQGSPRLLYPGVPGLLPPGFISSTGLVTAGMSEAMKLQKLVVLKQLQGRDGKNNAESEQEEQSSSAGEVQGYLWEKERIQSPTASVAQCESLQQNHRLGASLDLPFMVMPHPLLPVSLPPASVAMAMSQMNHLSTMANMAATAQLCRAGASVIKEHIQDSPSLLPSIEEPQHLLARPPSHPSGSDSSSPTLNHRTTNHLEDFELAMPMTSPGFDKQAIQSGFPFLFADDLTSLENLLNNIQGLLKVAVENTRKQEKQIQQEKKELKMELYRERQLREDLERQLTSEVQSRAAIQRRLKREKKAKRKLQEALEFESKRREQVEQALQQAALSDGSCQAFSSAPFIQQATPCSPHPAGLPVSNGIQRGASSDGHSGGMLVQQATLSDRFIIQRTTSSDGLHTTLNGEHLPKLSSTSFLH
ncbi:dachshund homolog 2-like isoform X2 [Arapaima gigas]